MTASVYSSSVFSSILSFTVNVSVHFFFCFCFCQNLISRISSAFPAPDAFPCQRFITSLSRIFRALLLLLLAAFLNKVFLCGGNSFIFTAAEPSFPNTQCVYLPPTSVDCFTVWIWTRERKRRALCSRPLCRPTTLLLAGGGKGLQRNTVSD